MNIQKRNRTLTDLMSVLTFLLFALTLLSVILTGAKIYRNTVRSASERFSRRTATAYITARIHQADSHGVLSISTFGDSHALVIQENLEQNMYRTVIYCHDGWLRELFCKDSALFSPEDGEKILPLESISFTPNAQGLRVETCDPQGNSIYFYVYLRSRWEG